MPVSQSNFHHLKTCCLNTDVPDTSHGSSLSKYNFQYWQRYSYHHTFSCLLIKVGIIRSPQICWREAVKDLFHLLPFCFCKWEWTSTYLNIFHPISLPCTTGPWHPMVLLHSAHTLEKDIYFFKPFFWGQPALAAQTCLFTGKEAATIGLTCSEF